MSSLSRFESILSGLPGGDAVQIRHLQKNTRTAELAAHALGVEVGAIVKSILVFADEQPYIALVAGDRRASLSALASLLKKHEVRVARAAEVKKTTGFAIGGVPPLALNADNTLYPVVMDRSLFRFPTVYSAAGTPFDIFPMAPSQLEQLSSALVADIVE